MTFILIGAWNIMVFTLFGLDKYRAKQNRRRIRERTLLLSAAHTLIALGYTRVYDFGGILDWPYGTVYAAFVKRVPAAAAGCFAPAYITLMLHLALKH